MANSIKTFFKKTPLLRNIYSITANYVGEVRARKRIKGRELEDIFSGYYKDNFWGSEESVSGGGSTLEYTANLRKELPGFLKQYEIRSILDAPCGDYNWFRYVERPANTSYLGADIVPELIQKNKENYEDASTAFEVLDITKDPLPASDLWICRDVLFHLANEHVLAVLHNFLNSEIEYLLTTSNVLCTENKDILSGQYRNLNLQIPPFNFPAPLSTIDDWIEGTPVRKMCLWDRKTLSETIPEIRLSDVS